MQIKNSCNGFDLNSISNYNYLFSFVRKYNSLLLNVKIKLQSFVLFVLNIIKTLLKYLSPKSKFLSIIIELSVKNLHFLVFGVKYE